MHFTIDRFEGDFAVCENRETGEMIDIPKDRLPEGAKEGDVLKFDGEEYYIDHEKTAEIKERIENKFNDLWG